MNHFEDELHQFHHLLHPPFISFNVVKCAKTCLVSTIIHINKLRFLKVDSFICTFQYNGLIQVLI